MRATTFVQIQVGDSVFYRSVFGSQGTKHDRKKDLDVIESCTLHKKIAGAMRTFSDPHMQEASIDIGKANFADTAIPAISRPTQNKPITG